MSRAIFNGVDIVIIKVILNITRKANFFFLYEKIKPSPIYDVFEEITGVFKIPHFPTNRG